MKIENSKVDVILQEKLMRLSEPFDELWSCRTRLPDRVNLAPLRNHALRVLRVVASLAYGRGKSSVWDGVYHNLHQVVSLQSVGLYTNLYYDDHGMCSAAGEFDDAESSIKERFVAGQLVFQGAWNALELAGRSLPVQSQSIQAIRHHLERCVFRPFHGFKIALFDAYRSAEDHINVKRPAFKEAVTSGSDLGVGVEILRQFRNGLLHGEIKNMDPREFDFCNDAKAKDPMLGTNAGQTEIFHSQIRLVLFLLQAIIAEVEASHVLVWPNDNDLVDELVFALQKEIPEDSIDHTDDTNGDSGARRLFADQKFIHNI